MLKTVAKTVMAGAVALPLAATAAETKPDIPITFSGSVALTNDYSFRGIAQSNRDPALQGGLEVGLDTGNPLFAPYANFWGSNVDFGLPNSGSLELDWNAGLRGKFMDEKASYDAGLTYYSYPGASSSYNFNYLELRAALSYDFGLASVTGAFNYSPDYFAASGDAYYLNGNLTIPLPALGPVTPKVWGAVGHQWIEKNAVFGTPDYTDYQLGVGVNVWGIDLSAAWVGTDLDKNECFGGSTLCEDRAIFTISKTF